MADNTDDETLNKLPNLPSEGLQEETISTNEAKGVIQVN